MNKTTDEPDGVEHEQVPGDNRMRADRERHPDTKTQPEMPTSLDGDRGTQLVPGADSDEPPKT